MVTISTPGVSISLSSKSGETQWLPHHTGELAHFLRGGKDNEPTVQQISFSPLDEAAIRTLAEGYGAKNVDEFIAAIRDEEIWSLFDIRPRDVSWLVQKWNGTGRLGKWIELLTDFCERALTDETPDRALHRELLTREAHVGLQRTAAAMLLGKRNFVSVPSAERSELTISSRRLFDDWTTTKVHNLLETALFVHKGMNGQAVQLAADTLTPFLAARWFARRVQGGLEIDSVQEHVMVRAFAEREYHVPNSRTQLVGWLATELPEFRGLLLRTRPDIVLFGGAPELLTDREIETALCGVAMELLNGAAARYPRSSILRKLARPSVEVAVFSLLSTRPTTRNLQLLALELARHGRFRSCVPIAISLALDNTTEDHVRTEAISAVIAAGDDAARGKLIPLISDRSQRVRTALLEMVPQAIFGSFLVQLMQLGGNLEFRFALDAVVGRISDPDLEAVAVALAPIIDRKVVDAQAKAVHCAALPVVTESIRRGRASAAIVKTLLGIEWIINHAGVFISDTEAAALRAALEKQADCRRKVIEARLTADLANPYSTGPAQFGAATVDDASWLASAWAKSRRDEQRRSRKRPSASHKLERSDLIRRALEELVDRALPNCQAVICAALPKELRENLDARAKRSREIDEEKASHEAKRKRELVAQRTKNVKALRRRLKEVEKGNDVRALLWGWRQLGEKQDTKRARPDVSRLAELVGDELVPSFLRGMQAYWRKHTVPIPDPSNNTIDGKDLAGLTGLTLEIDGGLDLGALSPDEATRAATYALHELNSFPSWFDDLLKAQPDITRAVLREAVIRAWTVPQETRTLLRFGPYAGKAVASMLRSLLLDVAPTTPPGARQALEDGIDTLLTSGDDQRRIAKVAVVGINADHGDDGRLAQWLRLLAHVDPIAAAGHMESMRTTDLSRYHQIIETVANFLEQDLSDRYRMSLVSAMHLPRALGRWFRLLLLGISPETDIPPPTEEARVVGPRDYAQDFRDRCLRLLREDPTEEAHDVLVELAADLGLAAYRPRLLVAVADQLEIARDAIARPWTEDEILAVERADERPPRILEDLFAMVRSHIAHVDRLMSADDDFSYRSVFDANTTEETIQRWAASCLRTRARGLYTVTRENMVADRKEVDISATAPDAGQVPIEIKPLGPYSLNSLKDVVVNQLLGQYMRPKERRCGILLLVRRERKHWNIDKKPQPLDKLVKELQDFARDVGARSGKSIAVEVIDLLERAGSSSFHRQGLEFPGFRG